ncbi:MAG: TraR/DksA C4-type zinc finger protein [Deltaproteobacteria bacterium]|jgi:phage/conjugal plasmid C-4 type zinc finger TraR family protein|nr:TraR/DksA C4-type zinc finger protein [Deltaproteobacteria bacterium]
MSDFADEATAISEQFTAAALLARKKAAGRGPIWEGGKAFCRACGEEIAAARVKALPDAELCIDCALEAENGDYAYN